MIKTSKNQPQAPVHQGARHRLAVIGTRKAGKTTLCASLHQSLIASAHGFSADMITRFPDSAGLNRLQDLFASKFSDEGVTFRSEASGPVNRLTIGIDFTSSRRRLFHRPKHHPTGYYEIEIADIRDDYDLFASYPHRSHRNNDHQARAQNQIPGRDELENSFGEKPRREIEAALRAANDLIICHPAGEPLSSQESAGFITLTSDIALGRYGHFDTITLALTKYEKLFLEKGIQAFETAIQPETIIEVIAKTIEQDHSLETGLRGFNCENSETPHLYVLPVSSYGFLRNNGAPNFDRQSERPIAALAPLAKKADGLSKISEALSGPPLNYNSSDKASQSSHTGSTRKKALSSSRINLAGFTIPVTEKMPEGRIKAAPPRASFRKDSPQQQPVAPTPHPGPHWLPFLAADPFLTAISGIPSQFMLPLSEFLAKLEHDREQSIARRIA